MREPGDWFWFWRERDWMHDPTMVRREGRGIGRRPSGSLRRQHGGDRQKRRREGERIAVRNWLGMDKVVMLS